MRTYRYNGVLVIESDFLLSFNKNIRGMALGWVILHRVPTQIYDSSDFMYGPGFNYAKLLDDPSRKMVTSKSGSKRLDAVLSHEYKHIERQRGRGVFKWMWKYITDKEFRENEERLAIKAENE